MADAQTDVRLEALSARRASVVVSVTAMVALVGNFAAGADGAVVVGARCGAELGGAVGALPPPPSTTPTTIVTGGS